MTRILVTGSRDWPSPFSVNQKLDEQWTRRLDKTLPFVVVHGGCPTGADAMAEYWARTQAAHGRNVQVEVHRADWDQHGRAAGPIRNKAMVDSGADRCVAFIRNHSRGASNCVGLALAAGMAVDLYRDDEGDKP